MKMTFEQWKAKVNKHILRQSGMESDDIPDWGYYDAYCLDVSPKVAARKALKAAMIGTY